MEIKIELMRLGKRQTDLLDELKKRGFPKLYTTQLSLYLSGRGSGPQCEAVLEQCDRIISEWKCTGI